MEHELRKQRSRLAISGIAFVAMGVWSILKTGIYTLINPQVLQDALAKTFEVNVSDLGEYVGLLVFIYVAFIVDLTLRLFIGLTALSEGSGRQHGLFYVVLAIILTAAGLYTTVGYFFGKSESLTDTVIPGIIDLTSFVALAEMTVSAIRLRLIRRRSGTRE